jgi:hypothetical protein
VKYDQAGDSNYNAATQVTESVAAQKANQTITFGALANKTFGDPDFTVSATASSSLTVSLTASGQCAVSGNTVHLTGTGSCTITASQVGDSNYNGAASVNQSFTISLTIQFEQATYNVTEDVTFTTVTVIRTGDTSGAATVNYATTDGTASERSDYTTAVGTLRFAAGEASKTIVLLISEDSYVEGPETFSVVLSNPVGATLGSPATATVKITDDVSEPPTNAIDDTPIFVGQHYHDFLNRQADTSGFNFWTNEIASCGTTQACIELKRINVSAAFFLSIEFQQTGYLIYRTYKSAYGNLPGAPVPLRLNEFTPDTQQIQQGVVVGVGDWQTQLETNKNAFALDFVKRPRFNTAYPATLTPAQFVDGLYANTGVTPSPTERSAAIGEFGAGNTSADPSARARVLRRVAENSTFAQQEFNRAFVLMQYFGYLRRDPNAAPDSDFSGYNFWLGKLNQFNGNFVNAEMVKAFLVSTEYRRRFGP